MIGTDVAQAAAILKAGGVVAFPTETVYGLGCHALQPGAVARVFEIKGRPRFDPLIVHVANADQLSTLARDLPEPGRKLAERFWPGPLTLVLAKRPTVPDIVTAGLDSVAVRIPAHPLALRLLREVDAPIAAPSANRFGRVSPTTTAHVQEEFGDSLDMILEGGPCATGIESTVVSLLGQQPLVLRHGGAAIEEIEAEIGPVAVASDEAKRPAAPGQLPAHYTPRTPLTCAPPDAAPAGANVGLLAFQAPPADRAYAAVRVLSTAGDTREAAANLFAMIRELDALNLHLIVAEPAPQAGLGLAINDRLRRAASVPP